MGELGLSKNIGPISLQALTSSQAGEGGLMVQGGNGEISITVEQEVKRLIARSLQAARDVLVVNLKLVEELSEILLEEEIVEGDELSSYMARTVVPPSLNDFLQKVCLRSGIENVST